VPEGAFGTVLLRALSERDARLRRTHLRELYWLMPPRTLDGEVERALEAALRSDDIDARVVATEGLTRAGDAALPLLARLIGDPHTGIRRLAVDAAGQLLRPGVLPLLERAALDDSHAVRAAALDGIARLGTDGAVRALVRTVDERSVPASVALAALLGLEQLGAEVPAATARRWLDDPLTCGAALRLLGRVGDVDAIAPSLGLPSMTRQRAAVVGLADALERGASPPAQARTPAVRELLYAHARRADWGVAAAALVVLGHLGDDTAVVIAAERDDHARLLPALHRHVELLARGDIVPRLQRLADEHPAAHDVLRELIEAAQLHSAPRPPTKVRVMRPTVDDESFLRIVRWFEQTVGLLIAHEARARVEARLAPRLAARGIRTFADYVSVLEGGDVAERDAAIESLTVHETYLFRERATLDAFVDEVVPQLASTTKTLRVWSAGCSTGEEAYTLAALLERHRAAGRIDDYEVWGTDVAPTAIARATRGRLTPRAFREKLPPNEDALFVVDGDARVPVAAVRDRVRFSVVNLVDARAVDALPVFDVVFCRNVLIYLSTRARAAVIDAFHHHIRPGGVLFLGHSESLLHVENPFEPVTLRRAVAYRRGAP
jgi:chemotaxis protein methyltransferase CheR